MKLSFDTYIGDDIFVCVTGNYDKSEKSVGYSGSFEVEEVLLQNNDTNIISLLDAKTITKLEWKGMDEAVQQLGRNA